MIASNTFTTRLPLKTMPQDTHAGLSGVFAAAVVNQNFRETLLKDPERALSQGYLGKTFSLSAEDASLIVSLNAKSLTEFAQQVVGTLGR